MNPRKVYWRRKNKKIIAEGKRNNKTIYLFTLPDPAELVKSPIFNEEKRTKILKKIQTLDCRLPYTEKDA